MADTTLALRWTGEALRFDGGPEGGIRARVDGDGQTGLSPMQTMLLGIAGCTAADIIEILGKMRVAIEGLDVAVAADRAAEPPRRYTRIHFTYRTHGLAAADESKLERAVALSHETYCSALNTLRPDVEVETELVRD